jgi:hypothetical protein
VLKVQATAHALDAGRPAGRFDGTGERTVGVDLESTPIVALALVAGLGLAALTATRAGRLRAFLIAVALIAAAWAALDVREVVHQLEEARTDIALIAAAVAALHLAAAAVGGRLARSPRRL